MKIFTSILLTAFLMKGCTEYKDLDKITVSYEATSRGMLKNVTIENKQFFVQNARNEKPQEIILTDTEWKELAAVFNKINLEKMNGLEGPTQDRFFDGKASANLNVKKDNQTYTTKGFDHGNPPAEIKEFVELLLSKKAVSSNKMSALEGNYQVIEMNGNAISENNPTMNFANNTVSGKSGCNSYSGNFVLDANKIEIKPLMATKMYCEEAKNKMESAFFVAISKVVVFEEKETQILFKDANNQNLIIAKTN